ncbi:M1 family metallopeptidase [Flagellimonas flava]|uniref:Peptidase M1 membrane alanine aminopeptidase domain-containing protein n=1 Tax=Flagellimonas flava TaxID=570519 RepID=A0A1M5JZ01_9FLAO|nr:M1 family metallopeptidase [Allomuricauda flava]SHG45781.1 hypothetical protein SAMN04488116_1297 [Allomuricauda flava]
MSRVITIIILISIQASWAQHQTWKGKFEQLEQLLPTPNQYRASDGSPGPSYWQQQVDYKISVVLDDTKQRIRGSQHVTYHNNSPQTLKYLWVQLDQNIRQKDSDKITTTTSQINPGSKTNSKFLTYGMNLWTTDGGMHITALKDSNGNKLKFTINKTMMRIDLPVGLRPGQSVGFSMEWWYNINDRNEDYGRSGYEFFPEDGNYVYTIAQFYPRLCVYDDYQGWQNKQFLGRGEFALTFGDFDVEITVPADHLVAATGELQNEEKVLSKKQLVRLQQAKSSYDRPVVVATQEEAELREQSKLIKTKTWKFKAENVRDFAFASSRKFIWDAQAVKIGDREPLAMSFYPKEGNPLWEKESTKAVVNTLETYSKYTIDYPYPVAISVHAADIGMEYPMICFNFGRPRKDGSYDDRIKHNMIGVIIHEVGHNFFPMIVNSDERQWTWMDEGLNSFLEFRTEQERYENFPSTRGPATSIIPYMQGDIEGMRPIMTNSEQVLQLGNNAYGKPATALNILRETVMKPELFDFALKTYSERWAFKHPKPADFFRTMEDASGIDLDWFWRGWFYTNDHVDISIDNVAWYRFGAETNATEEGLENPSYFEVLSTSEDSYGEFRGRYDEDAFTAKYEQKEFYKLTFSNLGGLVMPLLLEFEFEDGSKKKIEIPAEIWRTNENSISKMFYFDKKVRAVQLDPNNETSDTNTENNNFPRKEATSNFEKFKQKVKD